MCLNYVFFFKQKTAYEMRISDWGSDVCSSDLDKATMRKLNIEESTLSTKFHNMLVAAAAKGAVVVDDKAKLAGLSEGDLAAAAQAAQDRDLDGKWVFPLQNTTQQPVLAPPQDRDLRSPIPRRTSAV